MVIFPMPATTQVKPRLACAIRQALELLPTGIEDTAHSHLVLWAVMLGAVGAFRTENRDWYLERLRRHSARLSLRGWSEVRVVMKNHLWFDGVCDVAGRKIWDEVARLGARE